MSTLTGVGAILSASHRGNGHGWHGHSWEVKVWFLDRDDNADVLQKSLQSILAKIDHTQLPDELSRGEAIAKWVSSLMPGAVRVDVSRPLERIYARWDV